MAEVLLVGDDGERVRGARELLRQDGHRVRWIANAGRWREAETEAATDVVVAAVDEAAPVLSSPGRAVRGFAAPLLLVQGESDPFREACLDERIVDRIETPFMAEEFLGRVDALARVHRIVRGEVPRQSSGSAGLAPRGTLPRLLERLRLSLGRRLPPFERSPAPYLEVAARIAEWADRRDGFEPGHAERVTSFAAMIADEFGISDNETAALLRAAMLHDIGKIGLPVEVLRQRGPLEERQIRMIRKHTERGAAILRALDPRDDVAEAVHFHHEREDGHGYHGRKGESIPRSAKILAVAEAFDAMTTSLVRDKLTSERALGTLREKRGDQFDAACVDALVDAVRPRPRVIPVSART